MLGRIKRRSLVVVGGSFAAGLAIGLVAMFFLAPTGDGPPKTFFGGSGEAAEDLLDRVQGYRREDDFPLLTRSNAHAAEAMVRLDRRGPGAGPIVLQAMGGGHPAMRLTVTAVEPRAHRSAVVLMFTDERSRLVHYSHPVNPNTYHGNVIGGVMLEWTAVARQSLADSGQPGDDKVIYVATTDFAADPEKIRIPDGEVAVGLQYPDGTYSNFVPLWRVDPFQGDNSTGTGDP